MNTLAELLSKADFTLRPVPFCAGGTFLYYFQRFYIPVIICVRPFL